MARKTIPIQEEVTRFWAKVDRSTDCWLYTGAKDKDGYGAFQLARHKGVTKAHRYAYEATHGPIPPRRFVYHSCRKRLCCNPAHMAIRTRKAIAADLLADLISRLPLNRKLTPAQVQEGRSLYAEKRRTQHALSKRYKVHISTIRNMLLRRTYKDIP